MGVGHVFQHFVQVLGGFPTSHGQVVQQAVATVLRRSARNFAFKFGYEAESFLHQSQDIGGFQVALHQQVVAGEAAHRSPIDNLVGPYGVVAQEGGSQVFDGVQGTLSQSRFAVGLLHANVESGDGFAAYLILARYVDAAQQVDVVNGKTRYGFHFLFLFLFLLLCYLELVSF